MKEAKADAIRDIIREELERARAFKAPDAWSNETFSTLTIHFADGSEPRALSIPYQPWENRTDISIPYRLVKVDDDAGR